MSNIEDELLALAGGSDEEEEEVLSGQESRAESMSPPPAKKGGTKGSGSRNAPAKRGKKQEDSAEEDGEASSKDPGSPNSIGSAAMDESDSESDTRGRSAEPDEEDKYPIDGMFKSRAEREHIMSLREVERESILAERSMEIERQRQNRMLRQLVSKQENEEKKAMKVRKRTADSAELDDDDERGDDRKSARQRTETTKTGAAIDSLRRARAEKEDRARAREENRHQGRRSPGRGRRGSSVASSRSRDSFDDRGRSRGRSRGRTRSRERRSEVRELPPPTMRDFERIRVGRSRFAQYCFNPGFDAALGGCYVRVSLGPDQNGVDQYRMAKIKGFSTGKAYAMNGPGGFFVTDQYVIAQHGKSDKEFAFIFCSDKPFAEREFNRYITVLQVEGLAQPKTQQLLNKIDDINRFVGRSLTNEEIGEKVEHKRVLRQKFDPQHRDLLTRELEDAKAAGKMTRVHDLQDQLDDLQTNRLAFRTTLSPSKSGGLGGSSASAVTVAQQQDRLADINRERRKQNAANVAKAQMKEKTEARKREREQALERAEALNVDMSQRIRTKTKFVHNSNGDQQGNRGSSATPSQSGGGTPKLAPQKKEGEAALLPHLARALESARSKTDKGKKGEPTIHRPICDDDIIGEIDLELDIEID